MADRAQAQDSDRTGAVQPRDPPRVSILLVNFNGAKLLPQCLDSLPPLPDGNYEVILVDNGSTDESLEVLRRYPWVRVIRSDRNLGFAGGNNLGLPLCSGEFVLLLNNDTILNGGFIDVLCAYLARRPEVAIVQGKMVLPRFGNALDVCGSFLTPFGFPYHYGFYKPDGPKYDRSYPVFSAKGACLMFRREIIEKVGGFLFDEDFFCYYEESDFCHRAWIAGFEVHFVNSPPIQHLMSGTAGGPHAAFVLKHYLRNMSWSLLANLSPGSRIRILPLFFGMLALGMAGSALKLDRPRFCAHWAALQHCASRYGKIRSRRNLVRKLRRQPDAFIFDKVLRRPRLDYFLKTFTGNLAAYKDDELH